MKTLVLCLSLLLSVSLLGSDSFAGYPDLKKNRKTNLVVFAVKEFIETEINIEKWMTDLKSFHTIYILDIESDLEIEEWMTKEFSIHVENNDLSEQEVNIEKWMTNTFNFLYQEDSFDPEPEIEAWMREIIR